MARQRVQTKLVTAGVAKARLGTTGSPAVDGTQHFATEKAAARYGSRACVRSRYDEIPCLSPKSKAAINFKAGAASEALSPAA